MKKALSLLLALAFVLTLAIVAVPGITAKAVEDSQLTVTKQVTNFASITDDTAKQQKFEITIKFTGYELGSIHGSIDSADIGSPSLDTGASPNQAIFTVMLAHGQSVEFSGIPSATTYEVSESSALPTGWTADASYGSTGIEYSNTSSTKSVPPGGHDTVTVHNIAPVTTTGTLTVRKDTSNFEGTTPAFTIEVKFSGKEGPDISGITGPVTPVTNKDDKTSTFTISLHGGESASFNNVPTGTNYSVLESTTLPKGWIYLWGNEYGSEFDPANSDITIVNRYALSVTKTANPGIVDIGTPVLYTISGNYDLPVYNMITSIEINDPMFESMTGSPTVKIGDTAYVSDKNAEHHYSYDSNSKTIKIDDVPDPAPSSDNNSNSITISYSVTFKTPGPQTNTCNVVVKYAPRPVATLNQEKSAGGGSANSANYIGKNLYAAPHEMQVFNTAQATVTVNQPYYPPVIITPTPTPTPTPSPAPSPSPSQGIAGDSDKPFSSPGPSPTPSPSPSQNVAGASEKLPQTGGVSTGTVLGFAGLALIAVGGVTFLISRRRGNGSY